MQFVVVEVENFNDMYRTRRQMASVATKVRNAIIGHGLFLGCAD